MTEAKSEFRCPFEVQGQQERTILEVALSEEKKERLVRMKETFSKFYIFLKSPGIRFYLPPSLLATCTSNKEIRTKIIPYQSEALAVQLDFQLFPFLPYQSGAYNALALEKLTALSIKKAWAARILNKVMTKMEVRPPKNVAELSVWIEVVFENLIGRVKNDPSFQLLDRGVDDAQVHLLTMALSGLIFPADRKELKNPAINKNLFSIVKTPFYPKEFGRYSEKIELIMSREADFVALSSNTRRKIRRRSNEVLKAGGVEIEDLEEDKQGGGVWLMPQPA